MGQINHVRRLLCVEPVLDHPFRIAALLGEVDPAPAGTPTASRATQVPQSGRAITFVDKGIVIPPPVAAPVALVAPIADPATPVVAAPTAFAIRYYVFVPYASSRRAGPVETVGLPLMDPPGRPDGASLTFDETTLTLSWTLAPGERYLVYQSGSNAPDDARPLTPAPIATATFTQPVVFGTRVCFVVRSVAGTAPVSLESPPSAEVCETPADTFPPPAPTGLVALASPGAIRLTWDAVTAADLGGYIVLRGEGSGDRLQPLMTEPVSGTSFNDQTAKSGVRYFYAVVAVDKAAPPNRSKNSNVVDETGR